MCNNFSCTNQIPVFIIIITKVRKNKTQNNFYSPHRSHLKERLTESSIEQNFKLSNRTWSTNTFLCRKSNQNLNRLQLSMRLLAPLVAAPSGAKPFESTGSKAPGWFVFLIGTVPKGRHRPKLTTVHAAAERRRCWSFPLTLGVASTAIWCQSNKRHVSNISAITKSQFSVQFPQIRSKPGTKTSCKHPTKPVSCAMDQSNWWCEQELTLW